MDKVARGLGHVFRVPLLSQADGRIFDSPPTLAAGDAKYANRNTPVANIGAYSRAFTAGAVEPIAYETLTGATSTQTCKVIQAIVTSGSWGGGTAAGILFVEAPSGAFQAENLNGELAGAACMHIGGDFTAALMVHIDSGIVAVPVTSGESLLPARGVGEIRLIDAAGAEWCSSLIRFENRDERDGIVFEGYLAAGGSTTAFTLKGGGSLALVQPGCTLSVDGIPARQIAAGFNNGTGAGTVTTPFTSDPSKKRCVVYAAAPADTASPVPATMVAETVVPVTPAALPVLGTTSLQGLVAWLALRAGLGTRTFTKAGLETQRNVVDNATLGTATHTDDGTTVTRNKLA